MPESAHAMGHNDVLVIGAGQAGYQVAASCAKRVLPAGSV
jgi:pyruvate/2-oxoglutarate dehydrogenase complex dihydrolipoamide dehydrogenase (E3) component